MMPDRWFHAARTRLRLLFARGAAEARMREEFRFHVDMEAERLVREEGMIPAQARRRAHVVFGGLERYAEELREGRGLPWLRGLSLDLRLGARMLFKYPGLAVVGGLGMAVAIAMASVSFGMIYAMMDPALPVPEGDRVVMLQNFDGRISNPNRATHLHDLETWRAQLTSVRDLGAFRTVQRNVLEGVGEPELVRVAEMSASGFAITRVPPLLGRPLLPSDERAGAPAVVVIGEDAWRNRFGGDAGMIGRSVRLGTRAHTVVGVMPAAVRFPINHQYWVPLRLNAADYERGAAPAVEVFARLKDGIDLERARAEAATITHRLAATHPELYAQIRPRVMPYTFPFFDVDSPAVAWGFHVIQLLVTLLLVVVGVNVAVLMYARTTTRLGEITVRTALGASRRRIVVQLFAEALVLSGVAAAIGLGVGGFSLRALRQLLRREFGSELPFWLDPHVSPGLAAYVIAVTVLAAVIVGAVPALKATGRQIQSGLRSLGAGAAGMQLGRTWTALIVVQVAIAVAVLPAAIHHTIRSVRQGTAGPGYNADQYLQAWVSLERGHPAGASAEADERAYAERFAQATAQLVARLEQEASVAGVTLAKSPPGSDRHIRISADDVSGPAGASVAPRTRNTAGRDNDNADAQRSSSLHLASYNRVAPDFFAVFDLPLLAGRGFDAGDMNEASTAVVVDRTFVRRVLGGGNALGRPLRYTAPAHEQDSDLQADRQLEIVGVVADLPTRELPEDRFGTMYLPLAAGQADPAALIVRMQTGDAGTYLRRLRTIALETDPTLELDEPMTMAEAGRGFRNLMRMIALGELLGTVSVILLSAAGIYAMMSFAVARRRREIGIRAALGAAPGQLLRALFARAAAQLIAGVLIGLALAVALDVGLEGGYGPLLPAVTALMITVGLLAAAAPARRGLRIQPAQTLRED